jgi:glycosyltransferase involved in cell wall biosynthesis
VAFLHEWSLHHLVLHETREQGRAPDYLREMRRAYGERGSFVGRQVVRGLGGEILPSLFPLNERVLDSSLAAVALTRTLRAEVARRMAGRPVLALPMHFAAPPVRPPSREEARRALGLPAGAFVICAPGLATAAKRLDLALACARRLERERPGVILDVAGDVDPALPLREWARAAGFEAGLRIGGRLSLSDFIAHLVAADVVLALRFPSHGEMSAALLRALGIGRPALVTAGTPAALELPEGVVAAVTPGAREEEEATALLRALREDARLRERMGDIAREYVREHHDLARVTGRLADFLEEVAGAAAALAMRIDPARDDEATLPGYLRGELRGAARDLGLGGLALGLDDVVAGLLHASPQGL